MGTLMEDLQTRIESAVNKTGTYNEALQRLANLFGVSPSETGSRLIPVARDFDASIDNATAAQNYLLLNPTQLPTMGLNFVDEPTLDSRITFTRASGATYFNSAGVLTTAGNNVARFDYDPATLAARGLLIEEQRTNSIRNNTMQGAVAGTPGTLPTNWRITGTIGTLTREVIGTGTENGIQYLDVRFSGTTSSTSVGVAFEVLNNIAAANGQTWTTSSFLRIAGGSLSNINSIVTQIRANDSVPATVQFLSSSALTVTSTATRFQYSATITNATTAFVDTGVIINFNSGVAIDITLRIGLPQLEQGAFATSVIPTTGSTATRNADSASITGANFSSWYNATEGTLFAEYSLPVLGAVSSRFAAIIGVAGVSNRGYSLLVNDQSTDSIAFNVYDDTPAYQGVNNPAPTASANTTIKSAGAYAANNAAVSTNAAAPVTDTSVILATGLDVLRVGANANAANNLNGYLRRIAYYPRRLSNTELQAITA